MKNEINVNVVKSLMYEKGINQRTLAEKIGVNEVTVSRYFSRCRNPNNKRVEKIAEVLGVVPEQILLYGEDGEEPESAFRRVLYLVKTYSGEWSHCERMMVIDKLMW